MLDAAEVIAERGFTINDGFLHGFGIGLLPPSIGTRESAGRRGQPGPKFTFEENMCVVVQPNVVTHDERAGLQLGNLFRITRDGAECLHRLPLQYHVTQLGSLMKNVFSEAFSPACSHCLLRCMAASAAGTASAYPNRPVRLITGSVGSTSDIIARFIGRRNSASAGASRSSSTIVPALAA